MPLAYYIKLFVTLIIIIGVLALVTRVSKRFHQKKFSGCISVIDRLGVDVGVALLVVKVEEKKFLMSIGGKDIKLLKDITNDTKNT
jgi:flagellar biogenesis protein FliO